MLELRDQEKEYIKNNKSLLEKNNLKQFFSKLPGHCGNIAPMLSASGFNVFNYVEDIYPRMFHGTTIETFDIPEGVEVIGKNAFADSFELKSITIPDTVKKIKENAFMNCIKLSEVFIPSSVIDIGPNVFMGDENIKLSTPRRGVRNKLRIPRNEVDWYKEHLVFIDEEEN